MNEFEEYLAKIDNPDHRERVEEVLKWVTETYPQLVPRVAWNQPMFTDHGTFIIAFSTAKKHMAVAPEKAAIDRFEQDLEAGGHSSTKQLIRMSWDRPVDYALLGKLIEFNIEDKADYEKFWR
ncbi:iron chaperone [Planococcus rifietoensis]|uniref:Iron chaperone n=1 Tax=Planococcus rifietoensis TaxID=200991 RepID=A0A0U2XS18_9BACL|nr:iron chaperone [Planococcus rifietoensis]ALS75400.1 iron chaperone [Planococcus rifietoensis]